jgi:type IV secretion system protein VirB9
MKIIPVILSAILAAVAAPAALAQTADPVPLPTDQRVVEFVYSQEAIYTILTLPGMHTHIKLGEGEGVVMTPRLGDTIQWRVDGGPRDIFIKPIRENLVTSMTLVTNKRTYQFDLRSGAKGGRRYQMVSFQYPDDEAQVRLQEQHAKEVVAAEARRLDSQLVSPPTDPTQQNFNYVIEGDAAWKPVTVFDDGKFTYFRLQSKAQELPAFFLLDKDGKASLVQYTVRDDFVVIQRVAERFLLRLGKNDVRVSQKGKEGNRSWFWGSN